MKTAIFITALVASANAFAPAPAGGRASTQVDALADRIFGMDLFAPKKDQNDYGARNKKNIKVGTITDKSYVPNGLSKDQYNKIRAEEQKKKDANYQKNVAKAGKFIDFTDWYTKRGTELAGGAWRKDVNLGHLMAKTKYDWSGTADAKQFESTNVSKFGGKKKAVPKKKR